MSDQLVESRAQETPDLTASPATPDSALSEASGPEPAAPVSASPDPTEAAPVATLSTETAVSSSAEPELLAEAEAGTPAAELAAQEGPLMATAAADTSPEAAQAMAAEMMVLQKALEDGAPVEGQVIGWNKGGYHVAMGRVAAFCPVSQIEIGNPRTPKKYLDKTFKFKVLEIQDGGRRVVVSRAAVLKVEREARAADVRARLQPGAVLEGRVSSLTDFGAFISLGGGIEGLVHISEISRKRVEHPKDVLKDRQKVKVSVLKVENDGERISLSMKQLETDPWSAVDERLLVGGPFTGTILRKTDFGLFVEVESGLEGLVHVSRLPLGKNLSDESLAVGQSVTGWIHEIDVKKRRLSLALREMATEDPWQKVAERFSEGEVIKGKVEKVAAFGAFVELEPGLSGLLSFSSLSSAPNANLRRQFTPGREVTVRILGIDRSKRRISLGTEQSKAEGSQSDFREYLKNQHRQGSGLNALAAAFAKVRDR